MVDAEKVLLEIARELPPVVFRNWHRWREVLPMVPRTVANDDSLGKGPDQKVYMGNVAGYPRDSFLKYLRSKLRDSKN
jgi:hypothetical protein